MQERDTVIKERAEVNVMSRRDSGCRVERSGRAQGPMAKALKGKLAKRGGESKTKER